MENFKTQINDWQIWTTTGNRDITQPEYHTFHAVGPESTYKIRTTYDPIGLQKLATQLAKIGAITNGKDGWNLVNALEKWKTDVLDQTPTGKPLENLTKTITDWADYTQLAQKFTEKQPIHYDRGKKWWTWNHQTHAWELDDETQILIHIENALANASFTTKNGIKNELLEALRRSGRRNTPKTPPDTWIQFRDSIHDVKTGLTHPATPDYFTTNPIPWHVGKTEETPTIDRLFKEWTVSPAQDDSWAQTLHEIAAYSLLSFQPLQRMFALTGAGSNGKGSYVRLLRRLVGAQNVISTELKSLSASRFEAAHIYRKLLAVMTEVNETDLSNTNLLKKLTGEDLIAYEFKGKDPFDAPSYATCIVSTNSLPITPDKSMGYYRRWLIVDFPNIFPVGPDPVDAITNAEMQNWCRKLLHVARDLVKTMKFTNEGTYEERAARYEQRSNPVGHYIKENYVESIDDTVEFKEFSKGLQKWLKNKNIRALSPTSISRQLKEFGYPTERKSARIRNGRIIQTSYGEREDTDIITKTVISGLKQVILNDLS